MRALLQADGPHVVVDDLDRLELADADHHHLTRALRLRAGDLLTATNGRGSWRQCALGGGDSPLMDARGDIHTEAPPTPPIAVGFALVKGHKPELVVQKLTEIGVDTIQPFVAARSIVRWDETKRDAALVRLTRVAREAMMQSRSVWAPSIEPILDFADMARRPQPTLVRADFGGDQPQLDGAMVIVGPEGGWSSAECERVPQAVTLGDKVLRAETAAIVIGAHLANLRHLS